MTSMISDSIKKINVIHNDNEVPLTKNTPQFIDISEKDLHKLKNKLNTLAALTKKVDKSSGIVIKEIVIEKEDKFSEDNDMIYIDGNKIKSDEIGFDSNKPENLEGLLLCQKTISFFIPRNLKKKLLSLGSINKNIDFETKKIKNYKVNSEDDISKKIGKKQPLLINEQAIRSLSVQPKNKIDNLSKENKNESVHENKKIAKALYHSEEKVGNELTENSINKNNSKKIMERSRFIFTKTKLINPLFIEDSKIEKVSIKQSSIEQSSIEQATENFDLIGHKNKIEVPYLEKNEDNITHILKENVDITSNIPLIDVINNKGLSKLEIPVKSILHIPAWNILHQINSLSSSPNNITYTFKSWGNNNHQMQILFAMENKIQLIASTGRVYQASLDNVSQYQGRSSLSFENKEKGAHWHISSIDADEYKEDASL